MKDIHSRAPGRRAALLAFAGLGLAGCSALPDKPGRPVLYDFGPGAVSALPADRRAPLPPLALGEVETAGVADTAAVLFRLQYDDARQLRPYALARWSLPPAQLVRQRLRERLGERRPILDIEDAMAQRRVNGALPRLLRLQLEEFSQVFPSPGSSFGVLRLRATLAEKAPEGERLLGQRLVVVQRPAPTPDAAGGVQALAAATDAAADELATWLEQAGP